MKLLSFNEFLNESKSEEYFGNDLDTLLSMLEQDSGSDDTEYLQELLSSILNEVVDIRNQGDIILYRLIALDGIEDLDYSNLGNHWVAESENLEYIKEVTINDSGLGENLYLITIKTPTENINFSETLYNRCAHPREYEVYLESQEDIEILNVEEYE